LIHRSISSHMALDPVFLSVWGREGNSDTICYFT
jgi:hypothetical protein